MKAIAGIFLMIFISAMLQLFLPWWSIVIVGVVIGFALGTLPWLSFVYAFLAIAMLWGFYAQYQSKAGNYILAERMGELLGNISPTMLLIITILIGGITGGLATYCGALARSIFQKQSPV